MTISVQGGGGGSKLPTVTEVGQLRANNAALRQEGDKSRRESHSLRSQLEATQNQLRQSELARATTEEYARKLEQVGAAQLSPLSHGAVEHCSAP